MSVTPNSGIRKQDAFKIIEDVAEHTSEHDLVPDFISEEWEAIKDV